MHLSMQDIAAACNGILHSGTTSPITSITTDTRKITPGALFVPLKGERVDGHDYIAQALAAGAVCALSEKQQIASLPIIRVASTRTALMDLAAYYRRLHNIKVVAVTGSAGKTTTKEMMAAILSQRFNTQKTMGNFNNDIGLPLSIFQLNPAHEVLVLEMGMNHANEITELSKVGAPDIAVITHIGDAHIENFANREGILHAKLEIVDGLHPGGVVILNGDDPLLTGEIARGKTRAFTVRYPSTAEIISTEPLGMTGTRCHFRLGEENNRQDIHLTVPLPGRHMVMNALLSAAVGIELGLTPQEIAAGFDALEVPGGRLTITEANGMTIINDAYNANPESMRQAINVMLLDKANQVRRVAILGDIYELGHVAEERHRELGEYAANAGIDLLVTIGAMSRWTYEGYLAVTDRVFSVLHFADMGTFLAQWRTILFPGDVVLVKASRGMKFEQIISALTEVEQA